MSSATIAERIAQILELLSAGQDAPHHADTFNPHLAKLFVLLADSERSEERAEAEELIWALWCSHQEAAASRNLQKATGAMNRGELEDAHRTLDELVVAYPDWAEAWNKRATLHFIAENDLASLDDILATLELEPRHFGAICGFGQICLRQHDENSAQAAFQFALRIHPGLNEVRDATRALRARLSPTLH